MMKAEKVTKRNSTVFTKSYSYTRDKKNRKKILLNPKDIIRIRTDYYMGGIRPNREDPIICSLANKAATLMGFLTPGLQHRQEIFSNT